MIKLYGLIFLILGDVFLVRHLTEYKSKRVQCIREIISFLGDVTYGVTEWKQTLEQAILHENANETFPRIFRNEFSAWRQSLPLREALCKALETLMLPEEAQRELAHYFMTLGKDTKKNTEDRYLHTRNQMEELLKQLQKELPKSKKLIAVSVYATSAMITVLLL